MDSPCLSAAGLRFLDHPLPTEELGVPCGSLTGRAAYRAALLPDLIGVTTFRTDELRPGWVPSLHRGRGVRGGHVYLGHSLTRIVDASLSCPVFSPSWSATLRRLAVTMVQRRFTFVHPSGLPLACGSLMAGRSWASPLRFIPRRYRRRMGGWGLALDTCQGRAFLLDHSFSATLSAQVHPNWASVTPPQTRQNSVFNPIY